MIKAKIFDGVNLIREIDLQSMDALVALISTAAFAKFKVEVICDFTKTSENEN